MSDCPIEASVKKFLSGRIGGHYLQADGGGCQISQIDGLKGLFHEFIPKLQSRPGTVIGVVFYCPQMSRSGGISLGWQFCQQLIFDFVEIFRQSSENERLIIAIKVLEELIIYEDFRCHLLSDGRLYDSLLHWTLSQPTERLGKVLLRYLPWPLLCSTDLIIEKISHANPSVCWAFATFNRSIANSFSHRPEHGNNEPHRPSQLVKAIAEICASQQDHPTLLECHIFLLNILPESSLLCSENLDMLIKLAISVLGGPAVSDSFVAIKFFMAASKNPRAKSIVSRWLQKGLLGKLCAMTIGKNSGILCTILELIEFLLGHFPVNEILPLTACQLENLCKCSLGFGKEVTRSFRIMTHPKFKAILPDHLCEELQSGLSEFYNFNKRAQTDYDGYPRYELIRLVNNWENQGPSILFDDEHGDSVFIIDQGIKPSR